MKTVGVIREVIQWRSSRKFFYWRLRRRILECNLASKVKAAMGGATTFTQANRVLTEDIVGLLL